MREDRESKLMATQRSQPRKDDPGHGFDPTPHRDLDSIRGEIRRITQSLEHAGRDQARRRPGVEQETKIRPPGRTGNFRLDVDRSPLLLEGKAHKTSAVFSAIVPK